ncbi:MAG: hypothetical protein JW801_02165 [Bacteroidales bacterium]|nr:hypothetical protein [Bacteroidales bacterium]
MEKLFGTQSCLAEYHPDKMRIVYTLNGFVKLEEHKKMYLHAFEFMKKHKVMAFIHDLRELQGSFSHLNDWLVETFRPATKFGFKYSALIMNNDVFTAFAASDMLKRVTVVEVQVFRSMPEAERWLDDKMKESSR